MPYATPAGAELLQPLGGGAVFDVALVRLEGRTLVCKRLNARARSEHAGRAAIVREAKVLALVRHPALPTLVRVGADPDGPFLLETRREGTSLRDVRSGWRDRGRSPPRTLLTHVIRSTLQTLAELQELADEHGPIRFVHGDIGPEHVLLGPLGDIGLIDFGASRFREMAADLETADRGTLPFVAPEVARGDSPPTQQGDVYALAATLVSFVTDAPLTRARGEAAVLVEISESGLWLDALGATDSLSLAQRSALERALAHDPAVRIDTARALLEALDAP